MQVKGYTVGMTVAMKRIIAVGADRNLNLDLGL